MMENFHRKSVHVSLRLVNKAITLWLLYKRSNSELKYKTESACSINSNERGLWLSMAFVVLEICYSLTCVSIQMPRMLL